MHISEKDKWIKQKVILEKGRISWDIIYVTEYKYLGFIFNANMDHVFRGSNEIKNERCQIYIPLTLKGIHQLG